MMQTKTAWIILILQGIGYILLAPLVSGLLAKIRARLQHRPGPGILQVYREIFTNRLEKRPTRPEQASWIFITAPIIIFTCYALLGFLVPIFYPLFSGAGNNWGDMLLVVYLLGFARMIIGLAGMDTGAPLGGIGSSRELFIHVLSEPVLIFTVFALALVGKTTDLLAIFDPARSSLLLGTTNNVTAIAIAAILVLLLGLALLLMLECGRLPIDYQSSELELTMFGKSVQLEDGGPQLALLEWAEALRLTFFLSLLANLFLWLLVNIYDIPALSTVILWVLSCLLLLAVLIYALAQWEVRHPRQAIRSTTTWALTALMLALLAVMLIVAQHYLQIQEPASYHGHNFILFTSDTYTGRG